MAKIRRPIPDDEKNKAFLEAYILNKPEHDDVLVWVEGEVVNVEHPGSVAYGVFGYTIEEAIRMDKETWGFTEYTILDKAPDWALTWA